MRSTNYTKEINRSFGLCLFIMRSKSGLSQDSLAEKTGLHRTYIGSVERGERNLCLKNIIVICKVLKCTPNDLMNECIDINESEEG